MARVELRRPVLEFSRGPRSRHEDERCRTRDRRSLALFVLGSCRWPVFEAG